MINLLCSTSNTKIKWLVEKYEKEWALKKKSDVCVNIITTLFKYLEFQMMYWEIGRQKNALCDIFLVKNGGLSLLHPHQSVLFGLRDWKLFVFVDASTFMAWHVYAFCMQNFDSYCKRMLKPQKGAACVLFIYKYIFLKCVYVSHKIIWNKNEKCRTQIFFIMVGCVVHLSEMLFFYRHKNDLITLNYAI